MPRPNPDGSVPLAAKASFRTLVAEKPYAKITVSEICRDAGMSRKTFYSYFKDKEDLLDRIFEDDIVKPIESLYKLFDDDDYDLSALLITERVYKGLADNRGFYTSLVRSSDVDRFACTIHDSLERYHAKLNEAKGGERDARFEYASKFLASAQTEVILTWIRSGMRETPRQLATWFKEWAMPAQYALVNLPEA